MADSSAPSLSDLSLWKIKSDKCSGKINFTAQENCPLVARVPAIDKTGKEWQDTVREEERQSFIRVVNCMWYNRKTITPTAAFLNKMMTDEHARLKPDSEFPEGEKTLGKLDKEWGAQWLVNVSDKLLSLRILDLATSKLPQIVSFLIALICALPLSFPIAPELRLHHAMARFLTYRCGKFPRRLKTVVANMSSVGDYHIKEGSCYTFNWVDDRAVEILHIDGGPAVPVPGHVVITREFAIANWFCDEAATAVLHPTAHPLKLLFSEAHPAGPYKCAIDKKKRGNHVEQSVSAELNPAHVDVMTPTKGSVFKETRKAYKQKATEVSRKSLNDYREKRRRNSEVLLAQ